MEQRQRIIDAHRKLILQIRQLEKEITAMRMAGNPQWQKLDDERSRIQRQVEPLIEEYWKWIPLVVLSQCPFCKEDLLQSFDVYDLNGFWWMDRTQRETAKGKACSHFCLLTGALNFNELTVSDGIFECHPGPDKPFVIPRILEMPSMIAVVKEIQMQCGYTAYPIAYFSKEEVELRRLTQSWVSKEHVFQLPNGKSGWNIVDDQKDFNLSPWVEKKKLLISISS